MRCLLALLTLCACGSSHPCIGLNCSDPCAGLGCASIPGLLELTLTDATDGGAIASPTFSDLLGGAATPTSPVPACAANDGGPCTVFEFRGLSEGSHALTVSAPGHASATVTFTLSGPDGCCGQGPQVNETLQLNTQ